MKKTFFHQSFDDKYSKHPSIVVMANISYKKRKRAHYLRDMEFIIEKRTYIYM